ncbi:MAG: pyrroline-5-carboxylate reductase, partial [Rhizobiales bacterium 35-66-30]
MSVDLLKSLNGPVVLVGAGKMGGALLDGWFRLGLEPAKAVVLDPNLPGPAAAALLACGAQPNPELSQIPDPAVLVLAVKPQVAPAVLATVRSLVKP